MLIINADDYGWDGKTTDRVMTCFIRKRIHRASAMTFMADSERAAYLALKNQLPVGLHLNLDEALTGSNVSTVLREYHRQAAAYLKAAKWAQVVFNPFLLNAFDYVYQAQWDEFCRLYQYVPRHLDGHRHMHLCMNILLSGKIPGGIKVRRNFTFRRGEKNLVNRLLRRLLDRWLQSQFVCTDAFFSMKPIDVERLQRQVSLSQTAVVEIMVHPGWENEFNFLMSSQWVELISSARAEQAVETM